MRLADNWLTENKHFLPVASYMKLAKEIVRVLIGLVFITSAVLKLISVDAFEIYIFSHQWFSLSVSSILARTIISVEALLGLLLIVRWEFKTLRWIAAFILLSFSLLLLWKIMQHDTENCQCFGSALPMTPATSLWKNVVLGLGLFFIWKTPNSNWKYQASYALFVGVFALATPSIASPPDFLMQYPTMPENTMTEAGKRLFADPDAAAVIPNQGNYVVCMFSVDCHYCKQAAEKMDILAKRHHFESQVRIIFAGETMLIPTFQRETHTTQYTYTWMPMRRFFGIAGPSVPSIYLVENGQVKQHFHFRNIDENTLAQFFSK